jgi:hypothetical protein
VFKRLELSLRKKGTFLAGDEDAVVNLRLGMPYKEDDIAYESTI